MPPKRAAFTIQEKVAIRRRHAEDPGLSQTALCQWFEQSFGKPIRQGTVSEILSNRYSHLDNALAPSQPLQKRRRTEAYPALESALTGWFYAKQDCRDLVINGDAVRAKARFYWHQLPQYQGLEEPSFSDGWLSNFKVRHGIKQWRCHGEAASVDKTMMAADLVGEVNLSLLRSELTFNYRLGFKRESLKMRLQISITATKLASFGSSYPIKVLQLTGSMA